MVSVLSVLRVSDNSGARTARCIRVLRNKKFAGIGDQVICTILSCDPLKKVKKHQIKRGLVVRTSSPSSRKHLGLFVKFGRNAVILVNRRNGPIAKRLKGAFLKEMCLKYSFLGTVTRFIL